METHPYAKTTGFKTQLELSDKTIDKEGFKNGGIWFKETKTIICGTFPPRKEYFERKGYTYYSSSRNKFWKQVDKVFQTNLYISNKIASNEDLRIKNSLLKIEFLKTKCVGFIDIYSKVSRANTNSSLDSDLRPIETIFDTDIFQSILKSKAKNIVFVYSKSLTEFEIQIKKRFNTKIDTLKNHKDGNLLLGIKRCVIKGKVLNLFYYPMHGRNTDIKRLPALQHIFDL